MTTQHAIGSGRLLAVGVAVVLAGTAVVLAGTAVAGPANAAPTGSARSSSALTLGRSSGLPGQSVSFAGRGFRHKERVELHWRRASGPRLTTVTSTSGGAIAGHFRVPLPRAGVPRELSVVAVGAKHQDAAGFDQRCTDEWTDTSGGDWSNTKKWSTGAVPSSTGTACVTLAGRKSYTVTLGSRSGTTEVGSLTLGATSGRTTQTLRMLPDGSDLGLTLDHTSVIDPRGSLVMSSAGGNAVLQGTGRLENDGHLGTIQGAGWSRYLNSPVVNERSGDVTFATGGQVNCCTYDDSSFVNDGRITVASGSTFHTTDPASFTQAAGTIVDNGAIDADGQTTWTQTGGKITGHAVLISFFEGTTFDDGGGSGSYDVVNRTTLENKVVPAGQRITVVGDAGKDTALTLSRDVTNYGVITLTSKNQFGGSGNSFVNGSDASEQPYTIINHGTIATAKGDTYSRYLDVNLVNAADGTMTFDNPTNYPGGDVTNAGTLNVAAGAQVLLTGDAGVSRNFAQTSTGTLNVTAWSGGGLPTVTDQTSTAPVFQYGCGAQFCNDQTIAVAGTVNLRTTSYTPTSSYYVVWGDTATSGNSPVTGQFTTVGDGYSATYNSPGRSVGLSR